MKKIVFILLLCFYIPVTSASAQTDISPEKKALINELFEATGIKQMTLIIIENSIQELMAQCAKTCPNVDSKSLDSVRKEINAVFKEEIDNDSFTKMLYPIYDKHFTIEDLKAINAFYDTPAGKKSIKVLPQITQESMLAGKVWGESLTPKINERLKPHLEQLKKQQ